MRNPINKVFFAILLLISYKSFAQENYDKVKIDIKEGIAGTYYALLILNENKTNSQIYQKYNFIMTARNSELGLNSIKEA